MPACRAEDLLPDFCGLRNTRIALMPALTDRKVDWGVRDGSLGEGLGDVSSGSINRNAARQLWTLVFLIASWRQRWQNIILVLARSRAITIPKSNVSHTLICLW